MYLITRLYQRLLAKPAPTRYYCFGAMTYLPITDSPFPLTRNLNYFLNVSIFVETAAAVDLSFGVELSVNDGSFNHALEAPQMGGGARGCGSNYFTAGK